MTAKHAQALLSQEVAVRASARRRFVPPSLQESASQSQNQRWRERPRCPALPVAPARRGGVVHAIVGRVACRCHLCAARAGRTRRPRAHDRIEVRRDKAVGDLLTDCVRSRSNLSRKNVAFGESVFAPDTIASLMLAPCSASPMLSAALRPGCSPGLQGIDDASARHVSGSYAMVGRVMVFRMALTCESRRSMVASSRQCRTAHPPFAPRANGARIRPAPTGHGIERVAHYANRHKHRRRGRLLRASVSCTHRDLSPCIVLRTVRGQRRRSPGFSTPGLV
jgi:hypothetical protein